ncbi:hypothetical protein D3C84_1086300 [compost metagenome]
MMIRRWPYRLDDERHLPAVWRIADSVRQQVHNDLPQAVFIRFNINIAVSYKFQLNRFARRLRFEQLKRLRGEYTHLHR